MNAVHIKRNCPIAENAAGRRVPLYESDDPTKSAEENEAIFLRQMEQLKNRP